MLKMEAGGFIQFWWKRSITDPTRCLKEAQERPIRPRLSFKGLSGAFAAIALGSVLSVLVFIVEKIRYGLNLS